MFKSVACAVDSFADSGGADILVLGGLSMGDFEGMYLGSVSHKVANLAKCTCMTVK